MSCARAAAAARALALAAALLAALVAAQSAPAGAQTMEDGRLVLSAAAVWQYAEELFRDGEYYRAVSEYRRLLHFFPQSRHARAARLRIGEAHLHGGEPDRAANYLSALLADPALAALHADARYLRGLAYLERNAAAPYSLRKPHVARALADLRALPPDWAAADATQGFVQALEMPRDVPSKSPWLAGGLSAVLPGLGSAYVGNYGEAALAFFVNALFIGATVEAFDNEDDDAGIVLGVGALAFYGGAIYTAANGAHRFNDRARSDYLAAQRTRFGLVLQPGGVTGLLQRRF